jgi:phytoene dehydrogenase-like protein
MEGPPVAVIGGSLAGMAAAARLAKLGHPVELYEKAGAIGGTWAPYELSAGVLVDDAPAVLGFPAPWRDLFRKSGRPLEAELARHGYALEPAEAPRLIFADGFELVLPTDRGEQYATMSKAYGDGGAGRWRDLLDRLDDVWQALRPLGFESELPAEPRLPRTLRQRLLHRRTLAELAADLAHPHLTALLRSSAYRSGSTPESTPALAAVEHAIGRTFGRWQLQPIDQPAALNAGRSSVLVETLLGRLELRKVTLRLQTPVIGVEIDQGRVVGIRTPSGRHPAAAVVCTADPWQAVDSLLPADVARATRRRVHRLQPACAPAILHTLVGNPVPAVQETIAFTDRGVPTHTYQRPAGERSIRSVHNFGSASARSASGVAWQGFRSFLSRPPVTTEIGGFFLAGPFSAAGAAPSAVVLSGALAAYGCQNYLYSDVRPLSKDRSS